MGLSWAQRLMGGSFAGSRWPCTSMIVLPAGLGAPKADGAVTSVAADGGLFPGFPLARRIIRIAVARSGSAGGRGCWKLN